MKVLVTDGLGKKATELLQDSPEIELDLRKSIEPEELLRIIGEYEAIVVRSATKVTKEIIDNGKNLKIIGRAGAGVDNIDVEYATKKAIWVENTPGGNSHAVAELVVGLMFSLARFIPKADATMKNDEWAKKALKGTELKEKTLGVVGLGRIGLDVALMCKSLGMNVIAFDPVLPDNVFEENKIEKVEIDDIYKKADYITLHVPANEKTMNMINSDTISQMKDGVRLVNCARGGIVNESDLKDALESGKIAGAAVDVYTKEPIMPENPLLKAKNIILTPHLGASTAEAQENVSLMIAEQLIKYVKDKDIINAVNKLS